ncbi:MAG TPA: ribonuclease HII [Woeseiaceae bacterium]|nr:ribonuclease HII [Woeseiaceae bacterium]
MQQAVLFSSSGPVAGVDEAGRGPLAGPVVAAAVILDERRPVEDLGDSKKLTAECREELAPLIQARAIAWAVAWADAAEIDRINILQATFLAMRRAILGLRVCPGSVEVDGNRLPNLMFHDRQVDGNAIIGGDDKVAAISAASILAKVHRDRMMVALDRIYPDYGFCRHKGYATVEHRERILRYGPCQQHRRSFRPFCVE